MTLSFIAPFAPLVWVAAASLIWWRQLSSPWLFLVAGVLALLGMQAVISSLWTYIPLLTGNYFLEAGKPLSPAELERITDERNREAIFQAILVFVSAVPLLLWLKKGLATT